MDYTMEMKKDETLVVSLAAVKAALLAVSKAVSKAGVMAV